jgi:hypothetical protein
MPPQPENGLDPLPEQAGEGKSGAPRLHLAETHLSESPEIQQLPPGSALVPKGLEKGQFRECWRGEKD